MVRVRGGGCEEAASKERNGFAVTGLGGGWQEMGLERESGLITKVLVCNTQRFGVYCTGDRHCGI